MLSSRLLLCTLVLSCVAMLLAHSATSVSAGGSNPVSRPRYDWRWPEHTCHRAHKPRLNKCHNVKKCECGLIANTESCGDSFSTGFESTESPPYVIDNINDQPSSAPSDKKWTKTNALFDGQVIACPSGQLCTDGQALEISNAIVSGSFDDQVHAPPLDDAVGESCSSASYPPAQTYPVGILQQVFDLAFTVSTYDVTPRPGLKVSVSPVLGGDGRMSYLRFEDTDQGVFVFFDDVQGTGAAAAFVETQIAGPLQRGKAHSIRLVLEVFDGPSNDVVNVYVDGKCVHTGTSWENYYRYILTSTTNPPAQGPPAVRTTIFRPTGPAMLAYQGQGFVFDQFRQTSSGARCIRPPMLWN